MYMMPYVPTYVSRNFWRLKRNCLRMDSQMRASWSRWGWAKKNSWRTPWRAALYKCSDAWRTDEMFTCQLSFRFSWKKLLGQKAKIMAEMFVLTLWKFLNILDQLYENEYCSSKYLGILAFTSILFWKSMWFVNTSSDDLCTNIYLGRSVPTPSSYVIVSYLQPISYGLNNYKSNCNNYWVKKHSTKLNGSSWGKLDRNSQVK